ncbi:MAG: M23 family metallopeptidase [Nitrospiraceae bacterium]|nr:M23 family metallopeptidase [Nitrospiraceae bacterium]
MGLFIYNAKRFIRKIFTPVTIILIPHDSHSTIKLKMPSVGLVLSVIAWIVGTVFIMSTAVRTFDYYNMKSALNHYSRIFSETKSAIIYLQGAEAELRRLLSFKSREKVLENVQPINAPEKLFSDPVTAEGSINIDLLKEQMKMSVENAKAVADYLNSQKNIYIATPKGWPVEGTVTSEYGKRSSPTQGDSVQEHHSGLDISAPSGTRVKATADGVVTFSGYNAGNGNLVVIEHGLGYTTFYAHNSANRVSVGQTVKRGQLIALVGSTGNSTGPHLHYEVWRNKSHQNPRLYTRETTDVHKEK